MKPKNAVMLLLTSLIWGTAFVAQSVGMDFLEPFTFNGVRSFIGGVTLLPCIWLLEKMNGKPEVDGTRKDLIQGGIACGLLLFAASSLQQMGIQYTTAGKAGFITCILYCVCSGSWDIFKESSRLESVDVSISGTDRTVFLMY